MEITVIDGSDHVGWLAGATRTGEIYMSDVSSMVVNVISKVHRSGFPKTTIHRLNILDHGDDSGVEIGSDWIDTSTFKRFEPSLMLLRFFFSRSGFVHLQHCNVGSNHTLLTMFARAFGVNVYAGTGAHNPLYRFNLGEYDRCSPSGVCVHDVNRP